MSLVARMRTAQQRWGRRSLALILLAWMNVVLQPCALAFAAGCPDCPEVSQHEAHAAMPGMELPGAAMSGHAHDMPGHDGMPGTPMPVTDPEPAGHCDGDLAECFNLDDIKSVERVKSPAGPDGGVAWVMPPATACEVTAVFQPLPAFDPGGGAISPGAFPPRNKLFCVYLD